MLFSVLRLRYSAGPTGLEVGHGLAELVLHTFERASFNQLLPESVGTTVEVLQKVALKVRHFLDIDIIKEAFGASEN